MRKIYFILILISIAVACSKEETNPVGNDNSANGFVRSKVNGISWFADDVQAYKQLSTLNIVATDVLEGNPNFTSSKIHLRLVNINQPGIFGIGEDEPGFKYFVKATYLLKPADNSADVVYTAYYVNFSTMNLTYIDEGRVEADFVFKAYSDNFEDSVTVVDGVIDIDF